MPGDTWCLCSCRLLLLRRKETTCLYLMAESSSMFPAGLANHGSWTIYLVHDASSTEMIGDHASSLAGSSLSNLRGKCDRLKRCKVFSCSGIPMWSLWRMPVVGVVCNKRAQYFLVQDELAWVRGKFMTFANSQNLEPLYSIVFWVKCPDRLTFACQSRDLAFLEG